MMWWISLALGASLQVMPDAGGLRAEVVPDADWKLADTPPATSFTFFGEGFATTVGIDRLFFTRTPMGRFTRAMARSIHTVEVKTQYSACREDGVCRTFQLEGKTAIRRRRGSTELEVAADPAALQRELFPEPYVRTIDPAFEAQDTAYYAALDAASPESLDAALAESGPVLVMASFEGCGPCLSLARDVMFAPEPPIDLPMPWVLLDTHHPGAADWTRRLDASGVPTLALLDDRGRILATTRGYGGNPATTLAPILEAWERVVRREEARGGKP